MIICNHNLDKEIFIVAEIGNNHEGNCQTALELVEAASSTGVNAVKFQTFIPEKYYERSQTNRIKTLKRFQLSYDNLIKIKNYAESKGLIFFSTPFDLESARFLNSIQDLFKISSGDNTFWSLIKEIASYEKPTIISTGTSGFKELDRIYNYFKLNSELNNLIFLHCVSSYPVPREQANLLMIKKLIKKYKNIKIGYSDHTLGIESATCAAALGARIIEKHFTLDKNFSNFRDHQISAEPKEMKLLVERIKEVEDLIRPDMPDVQSCEKTNLTLIRRSMAASRNIDKGIKLTPDDIIYVRPGLGFSEDMEKNVIGKITSKSISLGELFSKDNIVSI